MKSLGNSWLMASVFLCVAAFCVISYHFFDIPVANFAKSPSQEMSDVFRTITFFGRSTSYLVVTCLFFLFFRYVRKNGLYAERARFVFLSVAVSGLLTDLLKLVFSRSRPGLFYDEGAYGFDLFAFHGEHAFNSFPSGHATTVAALAAALWIINPKCGIAGSVLAVLVMVSRIVLGSHFVSDVVFGAYIGGMTAFFFKTLLEKRAGLALRGGDASQE